MPRRTDIESILLIGAGPIIIGQAAEFDYSGTQALKVLREDGYRIILVNSNPATIMTDPAFADATYLEPVTPEVVAAIIAKERPDALLPTLGGQTALNVTMALAGDGVLEKYGVELIGAGLDAIATAEDRGAFKEAMKRAGIATARSSYVHSVEEGLVAATGLGYPMMVRPSYILGGGGTGLAHDDDEAIRVVSAGLHASPVGEVLVEESLVGWKEFELEVMRDAADNAVIVCSIENLDAMGVHTGDSITVAPAQTLSDREYQEMRAEASVGEAMAIGRTFPEALQKALRSLETGRMGLNADPGEATVAALDDEELQQGLHQPSPDRVYLAAEALRRGFDADYVAQETGYDPWFVDQFAQIVEIRTELESGGADSVAIRTAKRYGYSDAQLGYLLGEPVDRIRFEAGIATTFKTVDTCAAEFVATTPYYYSTYEDEDEAPDPGDRTVVVLGSGPNRIGQGIEFDYCCVHAAFALTDAGYEPVMINCNPETVSTDYDTSSRLYFEPLTIEDVLAVLDVEQPQAVIVQLGGQTPLGLAHAIEEAGFPIAGTPPDAIDAAEDRERFSALCRRLRIPQPRHGTATSITEAMAVADTIGFPVLVRPSYVLGGRAMRIVYASDELESYLAELYDAVPGGEVDLAESPLLIDCFLESAIEVDVDAIFDGTELYVGGIMEHVEEAGVHSGDSACVVPPPTIGEEATATIEDYTHRLAAGLGVRGLLNVQFAIQESVVFVIEANPRASRTVPFISKATGVPLAKVATRVMMGEQLADLRAAGIIPNQRVTMPYTAVKEAVLPWSRFPTEDTILGPEMRATGEVMGIGPEPGVAYAKSLAASGRAIPAIGNLFLSLADRDKPLGVEIGHVFTELGFRIFSTHGTAGHLARHGIATTHVDKVAEGPYDPVRLIEAGDIDLVINTPQGRRARGDGRLIRMAATRHGVPCITTAQGGHAVARSLQAGPDAVTTVASIQEHHAAAGVSP